MSDDDCIDCGRAMVRSHGHVEGKVRHHSKGRCDRCYTAFRSALGIRVRPAYEKKDKSEWAPRPHLATLPAEPLLEMIRSRRLESTGAPAWQIIRRALRDGVVTFVSADRAAVQILGVHPACVWGDDWWLTEEGAA